MRDDDLAGLQNERYALHVTVGGEAIVGGDQEFRDEGQFTDLEVQVGGDLHLVRGAGVRVDLLAEEGTIVLKELEDEVELLVHFQVPH